MFIRDAAAILKEMADKYPDYRLSVYANGQHVTNKIMFYAIAPRVEERHKFERVIDKQAFGDLTKSEKLKILQDLIERV